MGVPNNSSWLPEDAVATREYLGTSTGLKLISILYNNLGAKDSSTIEEEALNYRFVKGGQSVIAMIGRLAAEQPPAQSESILEFVNTSD